MATVDLAIANRLMAGEWPEDNAQAIVEYENAWGGQSYGVVFEGDNPARYQASESVRNPRIIWTAQGGRVDA